MSSQLISAIIQLLISAGFAGLVVQLLLIRQNRRKIEGEASGAEANAASVLSGAALQMVESSKRSEAEANTRAVAAQSEQARLWNEMNQGRWREHIQEARIRLLESILRQASIEVPPAPEALSEPPPFSLDPPREPPPLV